MKRILLFLGAPAIVVIVTIIAYGSFEKADSENTLTCQRLVRGYVYCDAGHSNPCAGAYVRFIDRWEHGNRYEDFTNDQGYFDFGYIACDDYDGVVYCGDDCETCTSVVVNQGGCTEGCTNWDFGGTCIFHIHTNPTE